MSVENKEPVDIFSSEGTDAPEEEEAEEQDEDEEEDESGEDDEDSEDEDDDSEEDDDDSEDDEEGDDEGDEKEDPKDREIKRLNGLLKTKNTALRDMRRARRTSGGASAAEFKAPYPDLKTASELPKEEQDAMTDTEKRLHDENVLIKQRLNDDAKKAFEKEEKEKNDGINPDALTEDEASEFVKASAKFLAKGNSKIANQIIRKYNMFKNDGLTEEQIEDRLGEAARLVKGFKPAKEMTKKNGKTVKKTKSGGNDIDTVVKGLETSGVKKPIAL